MDGGLLSIITLLGSSIAVVVGYLLKKNPDVSNKVIPWVTFAISLLTQIVNAVSTASASTLGPVVAFTLPGPLAWAIKVLVDALLQSAVTTGAVSWVKNGVRGDVRDTAYVNRKISP